MVFTHQLDLGGAQLYLVELLRELLRLEAVDPTVVSAFDGPVREQLEGLGIPSTSSSPPPVDDLSCLPRSRSRSCLAWAGPRDFELALVNTSTDLLAARGRVAAGLGIPAVWLIHESFEPATLWSYLDPRVRQPRRRDALERGDGDLRGRGDAEALRAADRSGRTATIPYALDIAAGRSRARERRAARRPPRALGVPEDADVLLCLGTVEPRKAQVPLAQAFELVAARHPGASC